MAEALWEGPHGTPNSSSGHAKFFDIKTICAITVWGTGLVFKLRNVANCSVFAMRPSKSMLEFMLMYIQPKGLHWIYYATGCGVAPYLAQMTGTMEECEAACRAMADRYGFQRNGNDCWLDDDTDNAISGRIHGHASTTKSAAQAAPWHCAVKQAACSHHALVRRFVESFCLRDGERRGT